MLAKPSAADSWDGWIWYPNIVANFVSTALQTDICGVVCVCVHMCAYNVQMILVVRPDVRTWWLIWFQQHCSAVCVCVCVCLCSCMYVQLTLVVSEYDDIQTWMELGFDSTWDKVFACACVCVRVCACVWVCAQLTLLKRMHVYVHCVRSPKIDTQTELEGPQDTYTNKIQMASRYICKHNLHSLEIAIMIIWRHKHD
jgi:hypothetical protein